MMKFSSLESPNRGKSNGGKIISLGSIDVKLLLKYSKSLNKRISTSIDLRDMILPPFDSPRLGDSNELKYIFLESIDAEIFRHNQILTCKFGPL